MSVNLTPETTTVNRSVTDHRLREASGFALVIWTLAQDAQSVPAYALDAVANSLLFSLERLCESHGLTAEGERL